MTALSGSAPKPPLALWQGTRPVRLGEARPLYGRRPPQALASSLDDSRSLSLLFMFSFSFSLEKSPVEAKLPWLKQARELEETRIATEEPT